MAEPIERVTLFAPGVSRTAELRLEAGMEHEWIANDGQFGAAFSFGTVGPDVIERLDAVAGAIVVHAPVDLRDGRAALVAAVERLREAGAIAVRIEQSKVGWEIARWLEVFSSDSPAAWHRGAVSFLVDADTLQSCGMHAFSLPDVQVAVDGEPAALQALATTLNVYQLDEDPVIRSGQTFRPDAETPRRVVERWPDTQYPPGHTCHNPYGVWRLGPPGGGARPMGELLPVFVPALHPLLLALAAKQDRPLTQAQVEAARDGGACIMMSPRDAQKLERARGYADLDPELAWEQWQIVRGRR